MWGPPLVKVLAAKQSQRKSTQSQSQMGSQRWVHKAWDFFWIHFDLIFNMKIL